MTIIECLEFFKNNKKMNKEDFIDCMEKGNNYLKKNWK